MQTRNDATVVATPGNQQEAANLVADINTNVAAIRQMATAADARTAAVEARLAEMATTIAAQESALTEYRRERLARPSEGAAYAAPSEARQALEHFMRTGDMSRLAAVNAIRNDMESRAVAGNTGNNETGGYLVLPELDRQIDKFQRQFSGLRAEAEVKVIGGQRYEKRRKISGTTANWEGEGEGVTSTDAIKWGYIGIDLHQLRSEPEYSVESLEDPFINMESEIAEDLGEAFGEKEADAHINGDGNKKPRGILAHSSAVQTTTKGSELEWNQIGLLKTGTNGAFGAAQAEGDIFRKAAFYVRPQFLPNAAFFMNRKTLASLVVLKDTTGQYIWAPSLRDGTPQTLAGYGVRVIEEMPDVANGATPVAFGDMRAAYLIVDRAGVQILRNPYRTSGQVTFFARKRTGGAVRKGEALKLIKCSA